MSLFFDKIKLLEAYSHILKHLCEDVNDNLDISKENNQFSLNTLSSLSSFKKKVAYCKQYLKHLGTGSARIVFLLPNGHALKLAYNSKGLAQNQAESGDYYKAQFDCFAKTFNSADDFKWTETELATKCKKSDFTELLGVTFEELQDMLVLLVRQHGRGTEFRYRGNASGRTDEDLRQQLDEYLEDYDNFFYQINEFIGNYGIRESISDAFRLANWGIVMRDNERWLVIIDSGLNEEVFDDYYRRKGF